MEEHIMLVVDDLEVNVPESLIANGFVHPQSVDAIRELYQEVLSGKEKAQKDLYLHTANNDGYRWERTIYVPVLNEQGRHLKSIGTSMDITEQKNIEHSFQETENLRAKITNGVMLNITNDTVDAVYSHMDDIQEFEEKSMTTFFQKYGLRMPDKIQHEQYCNVFNRENLLRAYSAGKTDQLVEVLCRLKDEEYRIMQLHIRLTKSPQTGDVLGYAYIIDVDDQRTAEAVMDKVALDHFEFILLVNLENNTAKMVSNPSKSTQTAPQDYPDYTHGIMAFCDHFVVAEQHEHCKKEMAIENLKRQLEQKSNYTILLTACPSGELRQYRLCFTYLNRSAGKVLVTAEDITELVREEQEKNTRLSEALEAAEKASAAQNQFLSNMSHDMITPMNAIIGFSQMALDDRLSAETLSDSMQKINESGHYLLSLINDILDMAKMESNQTRLWLEPVDAKTLFGSIIASVQPMMEAKHIQFVFENRQFTDGKAAMIDKLRMQQIFINLLSNAVKFTPEYGRVECITDTLSFDGTYAKDRITIRDNGVGMSEEFLQKAFLPFEQEETTGGEVQSGTGLGLSIVKKLVELMGGTIQMKSKKGVGTEVILELTTKLIDISKPAELLSDCAFDEDLLRGKRMLLCEDHPLNREIASRLLAKKGITVDTVGNGQEGLEKLQNVGLFYYDAILMDIRMPVMDGLQAAAAIRCLDRADAKVIPIIAMTANAFEDDVKKSISAGMNAHLSKPIEPAKLYQTLGQLLQGKEDNGNE